MSTLESEVPRSYHHGALAEAMVEQALAEVRTRGADQVSQEIGARVAPQLPPAEEDQLVPSQTLERNKNGRVNT